MLQATPAGAAWSPATSITSGALRTAPISWLYTPIAAGIYTGPRSGTGGSSYISASVGVTLGSNVYFDLANNGSFAATPTGNIAADFSASLQVFPNISISTCALAWNTATGVCSSGATTISTYTASGAPALAWGNINAGSTLHFNVALGGAVGYATVTATNGNSAFRAGTDRTGG